MKLKIHKAEEGGYWGEVSAMPGCVSEGETEEECRANVIEAAEGCMEAYKSMGKRNIHTACVKFDTQCVSN